MMEVVLRKGSDRMVGWKKKRRIARDPDSASNDPGLPQPGGPKAYYNKLIHEERLGTPRGQGEPQGGFSTGTLPNMIWGSGIPPGGQATSSSTVDGGCTTGGTNPGGITPVDRGRIPVRDLTTNSDPILGVNDRAEVIGVPPSNPNPKEDSNTSAESGDNG
jgi:hypothetical protein